MPASTTVDARRPIDIADRKQLFIDIRFFSRSSGIGLWVPPQQPSEPVLYADKPWEAMGIGGYNKVIQEREQLPALVHRPNAYRPPDRSTAAPAADSWSSYRTRRDGC